MFLFVERYRLSPLLVAAEEGKAVVGSAYSEMKQQIKTPLMFPDWETLFFQLPVKDSEILFYFL